MSWLWAATLQQMKDFLVKWECVCGTCPVCEACLKVVRLEEEEE